MSGHYAGPKPDGNCLYCRQPIQPNWDETGDMESRWFCSTRCIARNWMGWANIPFAYWDFDPSLPSCGPDRIRIAEDWIDSVDDLCNCFLLVLDDPDKLKGSEGLVEVVYSVEPERLRGKRERFALTSQGVVMVFRQFGISILTLSF